MTETPAHELAAKLELCSDGCVTIKGAVEFSGIGRTEIYRLIRDGEIEAVRKGDRQLIPRKALVAYLASLPDA